MKFSAITLATVLTVLGGVAADEMQIWDECVLQSNGARACSRGRFSHFTTSFGRFWIRGIDGCHGSSSGVLHQEELCIDSYNRRAHFRFPGQPNRCMAVSRSYETNQAPCVSDGTTNCRVNVYNEVACTW